MIREFYTFVDASKIEACVDTWKARDKAVEDIPYPRSKLSFEARSLSNLRDCRTKKRAHVSGYTPLFSVRQSHTLSQSQTSKLNLLLGYGIVTTKNKTVTVSQP